VSRLLVAEPPCSSDAVEIDRGQLFNMGKKIRSRIDLAPRLLASLSAVAK
jgi:hypothetical protein